MQPSMAFHPLSHQHQVQAHQAIAHSTGTHLASLIDPQQQQHQQQHQQHQQPPQASLSHYPLYPPQYMDSAATTSSSQNMNTPTSPTTSNIVNTLGTAGMPGAVPKKKPGRGPGRKDAKDRPAVSVRWEDGDLTERLIIALETNERWAGVFVQSSPDQGQPRVSIGVPKRDLQREIARHLFQSDPRYDINDKKTLEALAVSIKNKLFKITTLYTECKTELGYASSLKNELEIPQGSEHAATWARVKEKFPQFYRIRDMINRLGPTTPRQDETVSPTVRESSPSTRSRPTTASASCNPATLMSVPPGSSNSSALRGAVDLPRDATSSYVDPSMQSNPGMQSSYMMPQTSNTSTMTTSVASPSYSMHSPQMQAQAGTSYPIQQNHPHSRRPVSGLHVQVPGGVGPSSRSQGLASTSSHVLHAPQPQMYGSAQLTQSTQPMPSPYSRSQMQASTMPSSAANPEGMSPSPTPGPPSPPLSNTIQNIITTLTSTKEKQRSRKHEIELMKLKREEADRQRWHEREMMRLKIQLIRAERNAAAIGAGGSAGDNLSTASTSRSAVGGSFPSRRESMVSHAQYGRGASDEEVTAAAVASMAGDDMSVEGDGEGEIDDEMTMDPDPSRTAGMHQAHRSMHQHPSNMGPPPPPHTGGHHR